MLQAHCYQHNDAHFYSDLKVTGLRHRDAETGDEENITPEILATGRDPTKVFEALGLLL